VAHGTVGISIVHRLDTRLAALKEPDKEPDKPDKPDAEADAALATESATLHALVRRLDDLGKGGVEETDCPAARLLGEAEAVRRALRGGQPFYTYRRGGPFWLNLSVRPDPKGEERRVPLRVLVPPQWDDAKPPPLVVALHGAGGSENLFFDGYGNGKIVRLCQKRGWMLVAPRVGFRPALPAVLEALHRRYPYSPKQVFLVGHSMGAAAALSAVSADPGRYRAVAALGGAGAFRPSADLKKVAFFVAAGSKDFALRGARGLKDRLVQAGVDQVVWRELADVEHLGIVQQSLGEVFEFLDGMASPR
jgi:predicted esterase